MYTQNAWYIDADVIESLEVLDEICYGDLPLMARKWIGCNKNMLIRAVLRHLSKTMTKDEANDLYDLIYKEVNYGSKGYY